MRSLIITRSITRRDEQSLGKYLNEISKQDVLTADEELELFKRYEQGDEEALNKIVTHNLRFVVSVAKQYQAKGTWLGDLINEGNIGLIKAARRFDHTKGFKFISYAVWWIRQSILQSLHEKSRNIRLPLNLVNHISKVYNATVEILQEEERMPSNEEVAERTGLSIKKVEKAIENYERTKSLDATIKRDSKDAFMVLMEDKSIRPPDFDVSVLETQQIEVRELLKNLSYRQSTVLSMYYGIGQPEASSLSDIGEQLGLTRERVRQIKDKGLHQLRKKANRSQLTMTMR